MNVPNRISLPNRINPLDWVYPPRCMSCRNVLHLNEPLRRRYMLCTHCRTLLTPLREPLCRRCGHPLEADGAPCPSCWSRQALYTRNISAYAYEELPREILHEMKFRSRKQYAKGIGALMADACAAIDFSDASGFVPVPMFKRKQRKRGFNQATEMARVLSKRFGVPVAEALVRVRETPPQSGLSPHGRADNMRDAFQINLKYEIKNKFFYLVDDIHTTGATLNACAKTLLEGGAEEIACITFALAVKNKKD